MGIGKEVPGFASGDFPKDAPFALSLCFGSFGFAGWVFFFSVFLCILREGFSFQVQPSSPGTDLNNAPSHHFP